jgi:hypothetical protein
MKDREYQRKRIPTKIIPTTVEMKKYKMRMTMKT